MKNSILNKLLYKHNKKVEKFVPTGIPVAAEDLTKESPDVAARMRQSRKEEFDKSAVSDSLTGSSRLDHTSQFSDKAKEKRKEDAKFWEQKNRDYLKGHPEKRGGR